jgi:hypothetical protein
VFFVDDSIFITGSHEELELLAPLLIQHFKHLGMQMHVGSNNVKSKTEAIFFPAPLKEPPSLILPNNQHIQFTQCFKYLGSQVTTELNKDAEIKTHIKKAKSTMDFAKHFFSNKDMDIRMKHKICNAFTINATIWGCEA